MLFENRGAVEKNKVVLAVFVGAGEDCGLGRFVFMRDDWARV